VALYCLFLWKWQLFFLSMSALNIQTDLIRFRSQYAGSRIESNRIESNRIEIVLRQNIKSADISKHQIVVHWIDIILYGDQTVQVWYFSGSNMQRGVDVACLTLTKSLLAWPCRPQQPRITFEECATSSGHHFNCMWIVKITSIKLMRSWSFPILTKKSYRLNSTRKWQKCFSEELFCF